MKKLLALTLALAMVLTLTACGGKTDNPDSLDNTPANSSTETPPVAESGAPDAGQETSAIPENANTATDTGVYLYDGAFLEVGQTIKLGDDGANLDMPTATITKHKGHMQDGSIEEDGITWILGADEPLESLRGAGNGIFGDNEYLAHNGGATGIVHNDDPTDNPRERATGQCTGSYVSLSFSNPTEKSFDIFTINGKQVTDSDGSSVEKMIEAFGTPAGAYCRSGPYRAMLVYYIWKSSNCTNGTLIMAYEVKYAESGSISCYFDFYLANEVDEWSDDFPDNTPVYLVPALAELGLYQ